MAGSGPSKQTINYSTERVVGNGSFGVVFQATCLESGETVSVSVARASKHIEAQAILVSCYPCQLLIELYLSICRSEITLSPCLIAPSYHKRCETGLILQAFLHLLKWSCSEGCAAHFGKLLLIGAHSAGGD